ncbi:MAG: GNAT family N-acetyltransferase [Acidimicrobiia bacterium]|nr:GNAT family N-acetyltransferase [Acidimicrobiia bacterium]
MKSKRPLAKVESIDSSEFGTAGRVLGKAFQTDPLWTAVIADSDRRQEKLTRMFTALTQTTVMSGGLAEGTPGLDGVALWMPPGRDLGLWAMVRTGFAIPRFAMALPKPDRKRMLSVLRQIAERQKAVMPEPHWYVSAVGVDPESQGIGIGSALMEHGIARADREGAPVYLETETASNVAFYKKLGFNVLDEFTPAGVDVKLWHMARRDL